MAKKKASGDSAEEIATEIRAELERRCAPPMSKAMYRDVLVETISGLESNLEAVKCELEDEDEDDEDDDDLVGMDEMDAPDGESGNE